MATCVQSNLDFGQECDINVTTEERQLSRTDQFVRNFLTNEIWRKNELSPFIAKIVTKIKSTDESLWKPKVEETSPGHSYESSSYGYNTKDCHSVKEQSINQQESGLFEADSLLETVLPPHEHLTGTGNAICNALYEDGRQEGSVWKDNVTRYNNPFDPRLKFDGLLPDTLRERCEAKPDVYQPDTYNCYLDILNPSGFTNSYLKYYRQCLEEFRRDKIRSDQSTSNSAEKTSDLHGKSLSHRNDSELEFPEYVGESSEFVDMWTKIEQTQVFWTREDYRWLDSVKFNNDTQNVASLTSVNEAQMNKSVQYNQHGRYRNDRLPTDMTSDVGKPCDDVLHWTSHALIPNNGENNAHTPHSSVNLHGNEPHSYPLHAYPGQQTNPMAKNETVQDCNNLRAGQTYRQTDTQPTHVIDSNLSSGAWSNGETGDYSSLKNVHKEHRTNQWKNEEFHQFPMSYFPVVPELTTSMFWSHQKREYQNKRNASSKNLWQDGPPHRTVVSDDSVPIPYERNGQRCDEFPHQSVEMKSNKVDKQWTSIAKNGQQEEQVTNGHTHSKTSEYVPHCGYDLQGVRGANGYHSYPQSTNDYNRPSNGKHRRNGANRGISTNHVNDAQKMGGYVISEVVDTPAHGNQLINVNALNGIRQDLKFDDEVWYINGVPHQHAKPLCPQTSNLQYVVDVAPDAWSQNQGWSTGPTPDTIANFTEYHPSNVSHDSVLNHSQTEYKSSANMQPPIHTMQQAGRGSNVYGCYKNSSNYNSYQCNTNNNSTINEMVGKSTGSCVPKLTANISVGSDSELSPTSSLSSSSMQSSSNAMPGYISESDKESPTRDTPVSWLETSDARIDSDRKVKYTKLNKTLPSDETREYDSCDSSDSSRAARKAMHCRNNTRKTKRAHNVPGKQIKVLNGSRTTANTNKQKRHGNTRTTIKSCLIKIV